LLQMPREWRSPRTSDEALEGMLNTLEISKKVRVALLNAIDGKHFVEKGVPSIADGDQTLSTHSTHSKLLR